MDKEQILAYLITHKEEFTKLYGIAQMALFGSFARDEAIDKSDIDILVRYTNNPGDVYTNKRRLKELLQTTFGRSVDIANEKCLKPYVRDDILKDAIYV
jgi:uncharacterized protein